MPKIVIATPNGDVELIRYDHKEALLTAWTLLEFEFRSIQNVCNTEEEKPAVKDDAWLQFARFSNGETDAIRFGELKITME